MKDGSHRWARVAIAALALAIPVWIIASLVAPGITEVPRSAAPGDPQLAPLLGTRSHSTSTGRAHGPSLGEVARGLERDTGNGWRIFGLVTDAEDVPVPGARVTAHLQDQELPRTRRWLRAHDTVHTVSDANGEWGLEVGADARFASVSARRDEAVSPSAELDRRTSAAAPVVLRLARAGTELEVSVFEVRAEGHRPSPGVRVGLAWGHGTGCPELLVGETDADGRWTVSAPAGTVTLRAHFGDGCVAGKSVLIRPEAERVECDIALPDLERQAVLRVIPPAYWAPDGPLDVAFSSIGQDGEIVYRALALAADPMEIRIPVPLVPVSTMCLCALPGHGNTVFEWDAIDLDTGLTVDLRSAAYGSLRVRFGGAPASNASLSLLRRAVAGSGDPDVRVACKLDDRGEGLLLCPAGEFSCRVSSHVPEVVRIPPGAAEVEFDLSGNWSVLHCTVPPAAGDLIGLVQVVVERDGSGGPSVKHVVSSVEFDVPLPFASGSAVLVWLQALGNRGSGSPARSETVRHRLGTGPLELPARISGSFVRVQAHLPAGTRRDGAVWLRSRAHFSAISVSSRMYSPFSFAAPLKGDSARIIGVPNGEYDLVYWPGSGVPGLLVVAATQGGRLPDGVLVGDRSLTLHGEPSITVEVPFKKVTPADK